MEFHTGDGACKVLAIWIAALGVMGATFTGALAGLFTPWLLIVSGLVVVATLFGAIWYPPQYARSLSGRCGEDEVYAEKGVFWRQEVFIPVSSLRTVESWVTPLQKLFRCRTIILRFAGGAAILPLLPDAQAQELTRRLEELAGDK